MIDDDSSLQIKTIVYIRGTHRVTLACDFFIRSGLTIHSIQYVQPTAKFQRRS